MVERMNSMFVSNGLREMTLDGYVGPTFTAHRLVAVAERDYGVEVQDHLMDRLFEAYFHEGRNVCTDTDVLSDIGKQCGISNAHEIAHSDDGNKEVKEQLQLADKFGVQGVPFYVFSDSSGTKQTTMSGAQPVEAFIEAIEYMQKQ